MWPFKKPEPKPTFICPVHGEIPQIFVRRYYNGPVFCCLCFGEWVGNSLPDIEPKGKP